MKTVLAWIVRLSLIISIVMAISCAKSPQGSQYPMSLSGQVTISDELGSGGFASPPRVSENVFWIVKISIKRNSYSQPIIISNEEPDWYNFMTDWAIVIGNTTYSDPDDVACMPKPKDFVDINQGQSGEVTLAFSVPRTLSVQSAEICYQGQKPASFGALSRLNTVSAYDWTNLSPMETNPPTETYVLGCYMASGPVTYMQLETIASWQGTDSETKEFAVTHVPCIINYGGTVTSQITSSVDVLVWPKNSGLPVPSSLKYLAPLAGLALTGTECWVAGVDTIRIDTAGKYTIEVDSVGAQWWLKIGIEQ